MAATTPLIQSSQEKKLENDHNKSVFVIKFDFGDTTPLSEVHFISTCISLVELNRYTEIILNPLKAHPELLEVLKNVLSIRPEMPFTVEFLKHDQMEALALTNHRLQLIQISINEDETMLLHCFIFEICNHDNEAVRKFSAKPLLDFKDDIDYATEICIAENQTTEKSNALISLAINKKYKGWNKKWDEITDLSDSSHSRSLDFPCDDRKIRTMMYHGFSQFGVYQLQYFNKLKSHIVKEFDEESSKELCSPEKCVESTEPGTVVYKKWQLIGFKFVEVSNKIEKMKKEAQLFMTETYALLSQYDCAYEMDKAQCNSQFLQRIEELRLHIPKEALFSPWVVSPPKDCDEVNTAILAVKNKLSQLKEEIQAFVAKSTVITQVKTTNPLLLAAGDSTLDKKPTNTIESLPISDAYNAGITSPFVEVKSVAENSGDPQNIKVKNAEPTEKKEEKPKKEAGNQFSKSKVDNDKTRTSGRTVIRDRHTKGSTVQKIEAPKGSAKKPALFSRETVRQRFNGNAVVKTPSVKTRLFPVAEAPKKVVPSSNRPSSASTRSSINIRQRPATAPVKKSGLHIAPARGPLVQKTEAPKVSAKKPVLFSRESVSQRFNGNAVVKTQSVKTKISPVTEAPKKAVSSSTRPSFASTRSSSNMRQRPATATVKKPGPNITPAKNTAGITSSIKRPGSATAPVKRSGTAATPA